MTQRAIPHLKNSRAGSIIIMSSLVGRVGYPNRSAYPRQSGGSLAAPRRCRAS
ncbi:hypothetical protein [Paraburkholderia caribensis]|uniref:hypothetical protein n=1 Tax=Paraburkholderia caribensis TaxID=75105 RepID=UPI0034D34B4F